MNKAEPNAVVDDFVTRTTEALGDWTAIDAYIPPRTPRTLSLRRRVAGDAFLALMISWEGFFSDWMIAAVNRRPGKAVATLTSRLNAYADKDLGLPPGRLSASLLTTSHLNLGDVRRVLDASGHNIVARDYAELQKHADRWLTDGYETAVRSVTSYAFSPVVVGRLVRNAMAHASESALTEVDRSLRAASIPPELRLTAVKKNSVPGWRSYLTAKPTVGSAARVELLHRSLISVAGSLNV